MRWLKSLLRMMNGTAIDEEIQRSRDNLHETRKFIWEMQRAMLSSEDDCLFRKEEDRKCDGK